MSPTKPSLKRRKIVATGYDFDIDMEQADTETETIIPLLPITNNVLFPGTYLLLVIENEPLIKVIKKIYDNNGVLGIVTQKKEGKPTTIDDLFEIGTVAQIMRFSPLSNHQVSILIGGKEKFHIDELVTTNPYLTAKASKVYDEVVDYDEKKIKQLTQLLKETVTQLAAIHPDFPHELKVLVNKIKDFDVLTYFLVPGLEVDVTNKQSLLETKEPKKRATLLLKYLQQNIKTAQLKKRIHDKIYNEVGQLQRSAYIRKQIKALQEELGEEDEQEGEIDDLRERAAKKRWSKEVLAYFHKSLNKAERMGPAHADYAVLINHAELLLDLPWNTYTTDNTDLAYATKVLDAEHYGIEKVKERLLEYLAVTQLKKNMRGPILCLYGPPGVGKTTLAHAIAKAVKRKYARIALGGIDDEAQIRGHRKTYIGAMPGRIIKEIERVKSANPVLLLDEIDKINDRKGDPSAALMEVLDPQQNNAFVDNYLDIPFDLSKVLFITTANQLDTIPPALLDRLEVIELTGYTIEEKLQIAKKHLFPKQRKENGLRANQVAIQDEAIVKLIENYTRESGIRELERKLASVVRKIGKAIVAGKSYPKVIHEQDIHTLLGPEEFNLEKHQENNLPGVAMGLAWTPVGGDVLFIETTLTPGKEKLTLSGQLGAVMKESAITALTYLKAHAELLAIDPKIFEHYDLHIHIPAGATPKDGPSAGITLCTALASLYTQRKVKDKLAMSGEITLRGKVLPVGGIKEKILAAKRFGIDQIILSEENKKDIQEIKSEDIAGIQFNYVTSVDEVFQRALTPEKVSNAKTWSYPTSKTKHRKSPATITYQPRVI